MNLSHYLQKLEINWRLYSFENDILFYSALIYFWGTIISVSSLHSLFIILFLPEMLLVWIYFCRKLIYCIIVFVPFKTNNFLQSIFISSLDSNFISKVTIMFFKSLVCLVPFLRLLSLLLSLETIKFILESTYQSYPLIFVSPIAVV